MRREMLPLPVTPMATEVDVALYHSHGPYAGHILTKVSLGHIIERFGQQLASSYIRNNVLIARMPAGTAIASARDRIACNRSLSDTSSGVNEGS